MIINLHIAEISRKIVLKSIFNKDENKKISKHGIIRHVPV